MALPTAPSNRLQRWLRVSTYWDCVHSFAELRARHARRLPNRLIDFESLRPRKQKKRSYWPVLNTGQTWHNAGGSVAGYETFTYDADGNQLTAANANGTYTLTYNAVAEVTNELGPFGADLTMTYDADGHRTVVQDQFGGVTTSMYDGDGNLTEEETGGSGLTPLRMNFTYNADGEEIGETRYSNLAGTTVVATTSLVYDAAGNVTGQVDKTGGGTSIASYTNIYDANNEITSEQLNGGARTTYTYDADGEVTSDGTNTESYDAEGNRTDTGYTTTTGNELQTDGTWDYTYDAAGNETEKINIATGVAWTYGYDDKNELVKAQEWSMNPYVYGTAYIEVEVDYKYDAWGNLLESDSYPTGSGSPVVTRYEVDGWNPALAGSTGNSRFNVFADLDGSNNLQTRYLHGDQVDQLLARIDNAGNAYWTLTDRQGSVRDVIDNSGNVKDAINYDAFGNIISETNSAYRGSYAWTGRELDVETDLQYNRARWYDPATSRWMSQDPLGFDAGDSNLYRYVNNRDTLEVDPSGFVPNLTYKQINAPVPGPFGAYIWPIEWQLEPEKTKTGGWIVQRIDYSVKLTCKGQDVTQDYFKLLGPNYQSQESYWEAWEVEPGSDTPTGGQIYKLDSMLASWVDTLRKSSVGAAPPGLAAIDAAIGWNQSGKWDNTSDYWYWSQPFAPTLGKVSYDKGNEKVTGTAFFVGNPELSTVMFKNKVATAGGLPSLLTNANGAPAMVKWLAKNEGVTSNTIQRTLTSNWDTGANYLTSVALSSVSS